MITDKLRIFQNTILGALGGLCGWAWITLMLRFDTADIVLLFAKDAGLGALIGVSIGVAIGFAEQRLGGWRQARLQRLLLSGLVGATAGFIGLVVGEAIFLLSGGGLWPRAVGWALFGLLLGAGQGFTTRMPSKSGYGALGGLLGGLIGGATYERLSLVLRESGLNRDLALTVGGAIGLILLGAAIALFISLVEDILRHAWLRFVSGPLEGTTFTLDSRRATLTIGQSDSCDIHIRYDDEVQPEHAAIEVHNQEFYLAAREGTVYLRSPQGMRSVEKHLLVDGDTVQISKSRLVFQTGGE